MAVVTLTMTLNLSREISLCTLHHLRAYAASVKLITSTKKVEMWGASHLKASAFNLVTNPCELRLKSYVYRFLYLWLQSSLGSSSSSAMGPSASFQSAGAYAPFRAPVQTYGQFGGAAMGAPQFGAPGGKQMFYDVYLFLTVAQV